MQTNTTGGPHDRPRSLTALAATPNRPACATAKDIIARTLTLHWAWPTVMDGNVMWVRCGAEGCDFESSRAALVGEEGVWAEHAYHVADLLELAGIGETAGVAAAERVRLADKLDEEATRRTSMSRTSVNWRRWSDESTLGWTQAASHLRHPTATE